MSDDEEEGWGMAQRKVPEDYALAQKLYREVDGLKWCLAEQYVADDETVLRGGNEVVSFYCRRTPEEAAAMADALEKIVGPIRRKDALNRIAEIERLVAEIRPLLETQ